MRNFLPRQSHQITKRQPNLSRRRSIWPTNNFFKNDDILNHLKINGENNCFSTLKDQKNNFANNPQVRFINPAKNELGRISCTG